MLTGELLAKVRKIEIRTRKMVEDLTGGAYHSVYKGRGIEFSEVREYTQDDDVRNIDWNVTARMGTPFVKQYSEERELTVILAVDASASLNFGSGNEKKREKTAETAALLALSAIRNHDKVGLLVFTDKTELYLAPKSGRSHVLRLIRELLAFRPASGRTDIGSAADSLIRNLKRRSVIFLISDFLDGKNYEKPLTILSGRHDTAAIRISDPVEMEFPKSVILNLSDAEDGSTLLFDASQRDGIGHYSLLAGAQRMSEDRLFRRAGVDVIDLRTDEDPVKPLMRFFGRRSRRKRV